MNADSPQDLAAPVIAYFDAMLPLTDEEKQMLASKCKPRTYRKRQFVLQEGDVCNTVNFVVSGCLRMYKIDEAGTIHIIQFAIENRWISDMGSFYSESPSELSIEAVEDTTVLQIKHNELLDLYERAQKFNRLFRVMVERNLIGMQHRLLQNMSADASVRYESFLKQYPDLANRIPNTYIAAYLGITPEFLSKIRNKRAAH